jgi:NitT/TauT family transport system substrate-binding protein
MKKIVLLILAVCLILSIGCISKPSTTAANLEPVSLQLQWIPQAQFAGYYVALYKGWYKEEGIDLTIVPGAADLSAVNEVASKNKDFGTSFLADLTVAVGNGQPVISIAQIQQMNGLLLIAKKSSGIQRPRDLIGKKIGIWGSSWESQLDALLAHEGISKSEVTIVPQGYDMVPFLKGEMDVASAMIYNEYHQVLEAGMKMQDLNIIDYPLYGLGFPGDLLFTQRRIAQEKPDLCVGMLRASLRGWQYAIDNPKEAVDIVLKYDKSGQAVKAHQLSMMREISRLVDVPWQEMGYTDQSSVEQMVDILLRYKVIDYRIRTTSIFTNGFWKEVTGK